MKKCLLLLAMVCVYMSSIAQSAGDYRSAATGNWNVAGSWQIYNGTIWTAATAAPSSADGVITIISPHTITITSSISVDQLIIASGATLDGSYYITLENGAGTDLTVNGSFINNTSITGAGDIVVNGIMNWIGALSSQTLVAATGIINLSGSGARQLGATLTVNGIMNITGGGISNFGGTLINNGTINKSVVDAITSNIVVNWSNAGTINILSGELYNAAAGGRTFTNTGSIIVSAGALFTNYGYFIFDGGSFSGTGSFSMTGGNLDLNAALTIPPSLSFPYTGGMTAGTGALTVTNFTYTSGRITGVGALNLNGTTTWIDGSFERNFAIAPGNTINLPSNGTRLLGATLTVNGTMNLTGGGISYFGGTLINNGTINKSNVEAITSNIVVNWSNAGTINVLSGELYNAAAGGRTFTNTGSINVSAGALFTNYGYFIFDGGSFSGTGSFSMTGGNLDLNAALTIPPSLSFPYTGGMTAGTGALTVTNFTYTYGRILGVGALNLNGTTTWIDGSFERNFSIAAGNTINLPGNGARQLGATLTVNGTMNLTGGGISNFGGTLINNGTINKSVVDGFSASIAVATVNNPSGIIKGSGEINFTGSFTNDGTLAPGNSIGLLAVNNAQPFSANSILEIQLLNLSGPGTGHDQVERNTNLTLNGTLNVTEIASIPLGGFVIINLIGGTISGSFTTVNLPAGYTMTVGATTVILNHVTIIPLKFISFSAAKQNNIGMLDWSTENEINTSRFEIERSSDGTAFNLIGRASSHNLPGTNKYQFKDLYPLQQKNYYRLKQVDRDGQYVYSQTKIIDFTKTISVQVSPNPVKNMLLITGAENYGVIQLINIQGVVLKKLNRAPRISLDVSNLSAGQYFIRFNGNATTKTISFTKQ